MTTAHLEPGAVTRVVLAFAVLAGALLPALLQVGYQPLDLETLVTAAAVVSVATALAILPGVVARVMLGAVAATGGIAYYLPQAAWWVQLAVALGVAAVVAAGRWPAITVAAAASAAALLVAVPAAPRFWAEEFAPRGAPGDRPAVIHLLLDEYAGPAGLPADVVGAGAVEENTRWYEQRGFTIFERAFSEQGQTIYSIAQMANARSADARDRVESGRAPGTYAVTRADTFAEIAASWQVRAITTTYATLAPALAKLPRQPSAPGYNAAIPSPTLARLGMPVSDRFRIMTSLLVGWSTSTQKITFVRSLLDGTSWGKAVKQYVDAKDRLHPAGSMVVLDRLIAEEIPRLQRGQYLLAHLLLPHYPYVFDERCGLRPVAEWRNRVVVPGEADTTATRAERYRLYMAQMTCTRRRLDDLLAAIARNPALADATVLMHGDHGSRIAIEGPPPEGYGATDHARDWHAAHFAVRLPGGSGHRIAAPVAIHDLFAALVAERFAGLDMSKVRQDRAFASQLFGR